jgi:hypothetical protein
MVDDLTGHGNIVYKLSSECNRAEGNAEQVQSNRKEGIIQPKNAESSG